MRQYTILYYALDQGSQTQSVSRAALKKNEEKKMIKKLNVFEK